MDYRAILEENKKKKSEASGPSFDYRTVLFGENEIEKRQVQKMQEESARAELEKIQQRNLANDIAEQDRLRNAVKNTNVNRNDLDKYRSNQQSTLDRFKNNPELDYADYNTQLNVDQINSLEKSKLNKKYTLPSLPSADINNSKDLLKKDYSKYGSMQTMDKIRTQQADQKAVADDFIKRNGYLRKGASKQEEEAYYNKFAQETGSREFDLTDKIYNKSKILSTISNAMAPMNNDAMDLLVQANARNKGNIVTNTASDLVGNTVGLLINPGGGMPQGTNLLNFSDDMAQGLANKVAPKLVGKNDVFSKVGNAVLKGSIDGAIGEAPDTLRRGEDVNNLPGNMVQGAVGGGLLFGGGKALGELKGLDGRLLNEIDPRFGTQNNLPLEIKYRGQQEETPVNNFFDTKEPIQLQPKSGKMFSSNPKSIPEAPRTMLREDPITLQRGLEGKYLSKKPVPEEFKANVSEDPVTPQAPGPTKVLRKDPISLQRGLERKYLNQKPNIPEIPKVEAPKVENEVVKNKAALKKGAYINTPDGVKKVVSFGKSKVIAESEGKAKTYIIDDLFKEEAKIPDAPKTEDIEGEEPEINARVGIGTIVKTPEGEGRVKHILFDHNQATVEVNGKEIKYKYKDLEPTELGVSIGENSKYINNKIEPEEGYKVTVNNRYLGVYNTIEEGKEIAKIYKELQKEHPFLKNEGLTNEESKKFMTLIDEARNKFLNEKGYEKTDRFNVPKKVEKPKVEDTTSKDSGEPIYFNDKLKGYKVGGIDLTIGKPVDTPMGPGHIEEVKGEKFTVMVRDKKTNHLVNKEFHYSKVKSIYPPDLKTKEEPKIPDAPKTEPKKDIEVKKEVDEVVKKAYENQVERSERLYPGYGKDVKIFKNNETGEIQIEAKLPDSMSGKAKRDKYLFGWIDENGKNVGARSSKESVANDPKYTEINMKPEEAKAQEPKVETKGYTVEERIPYEGAKTTYDAKLDGEQLKAFNTKEEAEAYTKAHKEVVDENPNLVSKTENVDQKGMYNILATERMGKAQEPKVEAKAEEPGLKDIADTPERKLINLRSKITDNLIPYDTHYNAHRGTSHTPEDRAKNSVKSLKVTLTHVLETLEKYATNDAQKEMLANDFPGIQERIVRSYRDLLGTKSRYFSPMISGPAKYPQARMDKIWDSIGKKSGEYTDLIDRIQKSQIKKLNSMKSNGEVMSEETTRLVKEVTRVASIVKEVKDGKAPWDKNLICKNLQEKLTRSAQNGNIEAVTEALNEVKKLQKDLGITIFADRNKIWGEIEKAKTNIEAKANLEPQETLKEFEGARIVKNNELDRIQLFFDERFEKGSELHQDLNKRGWNYSRTNDAYQRKLTRDAEYVGMNILSKHFKEIKPEELKDLKPEDLKVEDVKAEAPKVNDGLPEQDPGFDKTIHNKKALPSTINGKKISGSVKKEIDGVLERATIKIEEKLGIKYDENITSRADYLNYALSKILTNEHVDFIEVRHYKVIDGEIKLVDTAISLEDARILGTNKVDLDNEFSNNNNWKQNSILELKGSEYKPNIPKLEKPKAEPKKTLTELEKEFTNDEPKKVEAPKGKNFTITRLQHDKIKELQTEGYKVEKGASGKIFATKDGEVQVLTKDGNLVRSIGARMHKKTEFDLKDAKINESNHTIVSDAQKEAIEKIKGKVEFVKGENLIVYEVVGGDELSYAYHKTDIFNNGNEKTKTYTGMIDKEGKLLAETSHNGKIDYSKDAYKIIEGKGATTSPKEELLSDIKLESKVPLEEREHINFDEVDFKTKEIKQVELLRNEYGDLRNIIDDMAKYGLNANGQSIPGKRFINTATGETVSQTKFVDAIIEQVQQANTKAVKSGKNEGKLITISYAEITQAFKDILNGKSNAKSIRVENVIDDMLTKGYVTNEGYEIKPNSTYVENKELIKKIQNGDTTSWLKDKNNIGSARLPGSILMTKPRSTREPVKFEPRKGALAHIPKKDIGASRFKTKTVPDAPNTTSSLRDKLGQEPLQYVKRRDMETSDFADNVLKDMTIDEAMNVVLTTRNPGKQEAVLGMKVVAKLQAKGTNEALDKAVDLVRQISRQATNDGQYIQALAMYRKLTPEGVLRYAQKEVDDVLKAIEKKRPDKIQKIEAEVKKVEEIMNSVDEKTLDVVSKEVEAKLDEIIAEAPKEEPKLDEVIAEAPKTEVGNGDAIDNKSKINKKQPKVTEEADPIDEMAEALSNKVKGNLGDDVVKQIEFEKDLVKTLHNIAKKVLPEREVIPVDPIERVKLMLNNRDMAQNVWNKAKDILKEEYEEGSDEYQLLEDWFNQKARPIFFEKDLNQAISNTMKARPDAIKIREIVRQSASKGNKAKEYIVNELIKQTGLSGNEARTLTKYIHKRVNELMKVEREKQLEALFKDKTPRTKEDTSKRSLKNIETLSNLGAFKNNKYKNIVSKRLNPEIDRIIKNEFKIGEMVRKLSQEDQDLTGGRILDYIQENTNLDKNDSQLLAQAVLDRYYSIIGEKKGNILSGMFRDKLEDPKEKQSFIEKLIEMNNLGGLENPKYKDLILERYGIPTLSNNEVRTIQDLMVKAQKLKEGRQKDILFGQVQQIISDKIPSNFGEKLKAIQRVNLLLNTKTMTRNLLGNVTMIALENFKDIPGSLVDIAMSKFTGQRTTLAPSIEGVVTQGKGLWEGAKIVAEDRNLGIDTSKTGGQYDVPRSSAFKKIKNPTNPLHYINNVLASSESLVNYGLRMGDEPFYKSAYNEYIRQQLVLNKTKTVTPEMKEKATRFALDRTFQNVSAFSEGFKFFQKGFNLGKKFGIGNFIIPYVKTPGNLIDKAVDYTPVGALKGIANMIYGTKIDKSKFDQKKIVDQIGRSLTGTGIIALGYSLASLGILNGKGAENDKARKLEQQTGKLAYSWNHKGVYHTIDWMQPSAIPLMMGADIFEQGKGKKELDNVLIKALESGGATLFNQSILLGIARVFGGYSSNPGENVMQGLSNAFIKAPEQAVPFASALRQATQLIDNTMRDTYSNSKLDTEKDIITSKIPFASKNLLPRIDTLGREKKQFNGSKGIRYGADVLFSPGFRAKNNPTQAEKIALDLYYSSGQTMQIPREADKKIEYAVGVNSQNKYQYDTIILSKSQRNELQKLMGQKVQIAYSKLGRDYQALKSDEEKAEYLSDILSTIKREAEDEILAKVGKKRYTK